MSRPKSNEKVLKFLEDSLIDVLDRISVAVKDQAFSTAITLVAWKTCLISAIDKIKEVNIGKRNKVVEKLPE